ncbi:ABC transporter ATP-binding protein [Pseudodonghicola sp.]|uniref:ABC transporter ATP-binding protein n=1 Tax=Pseudodonghicola sp. TaxID=1969463 RepID=UPI003A97C31F
MTDAPSALTLSAIRKKFGALMAVDNLDLAVAPGALVSLLGPSGCGKTTTLRMVAGFEQPDSGRIEIGAEDVTRLAPNRRGLGMVFQSYSLFPHRTVAENIAFGLRMAGASRQTQTEEVRRMLDMVHLSGREDVFPAQLSGGQQQRVALARALVVNPRVLLLDEPLGALDKALRESMQFEIREMQQRLEITTLLVTHDQEEAMSMSDQIAVMNGGRILQLGAPNEIYDRPQTAFVATFLGTSNLFEGKVGADGKMLESVAGSLPLPAPAMPGSALTLSIRPERVVLGGAAAGLPVQLAGRVIASSFRGSYAAYRIALDATGVEITAYRQADAALGAEGLAIGDRLSLGWPAEDSIIVTA